MRHSLPAFALTLILAAAPAFAGIADSPLPELLPGETTFHLYSVPGVIHVNFGTFFSCTSTDTSTMRVGVEVFGPAGGAPVNDAAATSLSVAPGATVISGTGVAAGIFVRSSLSVGLLSKGSSRILATSKKLVCTAFLADDANDPPTSMAQLTIEHDAADDDATASFSFKIGTICHLSSCFSVFCKFFRREGSFISPAVSST